MFRKKKSISKLINSAVRSVLPYNRPYSLRSYYDMALQMSGVHPRWQSFFMGHKGDMEAVYTTHKILPPQLIEQMREHFKPAEALLTTQPKPKISKEEIRRESLLALGFTPEEVTKMLAVIREKPEPEQASAIGSTG